VNPARGERRVPGWLVLAAAAAFVAAVAAVILLGAGR